MKQAWQKRPKPKLIQEYHNFAANLQEWVIYLFKLQEWIDFENIIGYG